MSATPGAEDGLCSCCGVYPVFEDLIVCFRCNFPGHYCQGCGSCDGPGGATCVCAERRAATEGAQPGGKGNE